MKNIFLEFVSKAKQLKLFTSSLSIAYYVTLSFFPILIVMSALIPLFQIDLEMVTEYLSRVVPEVVLQYILPYITELVQSPRVGVLSISIIFAVFSASQCLTYIKTSIDSVYSIQKTRMYLTLRIFSIIAFIAISFLLIFLMLLSNIQEVFFRSLLSSSDYAQNYQNNAVIKWLGTFGALFLFHSFLYYIIPNIKQRFRDVLPGALLASLLILLLTNIYSIYLNYVTYSLTAYGVLSAFFVLLIWIRVLSFIVLLGALLNAVLFTKKYGQPVMKESRIDDFFKNIFRKFTIKKKSQTDA